MTSITLTITGTKARASVSGPLTSGMVGIPVILEYDDSWNDLTKNLVCRCGKWGPEKGETRTVLNIGGRTTVAHEVMKSDMNLYLGVEGYSADGKLVIPSTWADCGKIQPGANAGADSSASPKLSIWGQLQTEINQLKTQTITEDQIAAGVASYLEENPIELPEPPQSSALNAAQITALDNMFKVCAFISEDVSAEYAVFQTAFGISGGEEEPDEPANPEVTLTSISATYSGGDVAVGTAVTDLTGIVVTAHYSDGTSKAVTGYTLSGTIAEGSNTVTVAYQGKTATFTVTGVAKSGGETAQNVYMRNGEYLVGDPTEVTWGDNSLSYKMGTNANGVYTHVGEAYHLDAGKTYTLFADMSGKAAYVRVLHKLNDSSAYMGTVLAQLNGDAGIVFTVPESTKWINLLFGLMTGVESAVVGDLGTWSNIAIYEGELTKRP